MIEHVGPKHGRWAENLGTFVLIISINPLKTINYVRLRVFGEILE